MTDESSAAAGEEGRTRTRDIVIRLFGLVVVAVILWLLFTRLVSWPR